MTTPRILLVEDEDGIADAVVYALETEGMQVDRHATGVAAEQALAESSIDLIVLDVGLPDANGFELFRAWRRRCDVPVIFLTARGDEVDRVVGLELGADDYVVKPFSPRELAARVRAVLRRSARAPAVAEGGLLRVGPLVIDEDRCRVTWFEQPLDLSRQEYRMLLALAHRPGCVFSRQRLMDLAWDEPDMSLERTVDSHVRSLRAKLRAVREHLDPIRTHRGQGYSLRDHW